VSQLFWGNVAHDIVDMMVEEDPSKYFGEVVGFVDGHDHAFKYD
jgi:hypothetical protein